MNNEPVAWAYEAINVDGKPYLSDVALKPLFGLVARYGYKEIPLYTHPAKTKLSRMEVYELAIDSGFMLSTQYGQAENKLMPVSDGDTLVKLAKAILRKAQEK